MGVASAICIILVTILFPPLGVYIVAGCGADLLINICLTILGGIPGHIHAFYLIYVYYDRKEQAHHGRYATHRAPGIYSDNVQTGGMGYGGGQGYGTIAPTNGNLNHHHGHQYRGQDHGYE